MTIKTLRNLVLDVLSVPNTGASYALHANLGILRLQARGGAVWLKLASVGDTEYWILKDGEAQEFHVPDLAGATIYFDAATTLAVEILQILRTQA